FERHDQFWQALQALPAPGVEFRLVPAAVGRVDIDLRILSSKLEGEPFLLLAAIAPPPAFFLGVRRQVVAEPVRRLGEKTDAVDAGFFSQFAQGGVVRLLALIYPALRH